MTAITSREALTLTEAAKLLPTTDGKRVQPSTVWRWCRIGIKGRNGHRIRLEHSRLGRRVVTSRRSLDAFGAAIAQADEEHFQGAVCDDTSNLASSRTPAQRQVAMDQAERKLKAAGFDT